MKKFKVTIYVFRKPHACNPEESATLQALHRLNLQAIESIRMGRCFLLSVEAQTAAEAEKTAKTASHDLLANLVMDDYEIIKIEEVK